MLQSGIGYKVSSVKNNRNAHIIETFEQREASGLGIYAGNDLHGTSGNSIRRGMFSTPNGGNVFMSKLTRPGTGGKQGG